MRLLKVLPFLLGLLPIAAIAGDLGEPAYISDQKRITSEGLKHENEQFRARANFKNAESQLASNIERRDLLKNEFERAKNLAEKGQMTEAQLQMALQNYQNSEDAVARSASDMHKAKSAAEIARLRVLEHGNPDADHRIQIANAMIDSLSSESLSLQKSLGSAMQATNYYKSRVDNGKYLLDRGVISLQDFERRQLDFRNAQDQVRSLEFQISGIEDSLKGQRAARQKLIAP